MTLQFLATFRFTPPPRDPHSDVDPRAFHAVTFSIGAARHTMTLAQWAVVLGFYTEEETQDPRFYTDEVYSEPAPLITWWPEISDHPYQLPLRAAWIRDPLHRYIHRCLTGTITGRDQTTEQVTLLDLFFLRALLEPRRVNIAHCMAHYFHGIHRGQVIY